MNTSMNTSMDTSAESKASASAERRGEIDRRSFVAAASSALAMGPLAAAARAGGARSSSAASRRLIVVELAGGNDGLNTLVPLRDRDYLRARPTLGLRGQALRALDKSWALNASLEGLAAAFRAGELAILHGVGYPEPDRSHFRSMDIWHSARPDIEKPQLGWLGRCADQLAARGVAHPALAVGMRSRPLALQARDVVVPAFARLEDYQLYEESRVFGRKRARLATLHELASERVGDDELARFLKSTARTAYRSSEEFRAAAKRPVAKGAASSEYPNSSFGRACRLTARALCSPLDVRAFYLRQTGYDTHAGQARVHGSLLRDLDRGLAALRASLKAAGRWDTTRIVVFSEFGRRVAENKSRGTDHGAAAPLFVLGGGVVPGLHGRAPSLRALDRGDLVHGIDFRSVYAQLLESWLDVDAAAILGPLAENLRRIEPVLRAV